MSNHLKILIRFQILELNLLKLILKSKRIIKIIKNISGLKNIVFDNQIKCKTPKIEIKYINLCNFFQFCFKSLAILSDEVIARGINKSHAEKPTNTNFFFNTSLIKGSKSNL